MNAAILPQTPRAPSALNVHAFGVRPFEQALELSSEGVLFLDIQGRVIYSNPRASQLLDVEMGDLLADVVDGFDPAACVRRQIVKTKHGGEDVILRQSIEKINYFPRSIIVAPLPHTSADHLVAFATRDPDTGFLNRDAFEETLARRGGPSQRATVIVVAIDYGRSTGNDTGFARDLAHRLRSALPSGAVCGRLGGGLFAALLPDGCEPQIVADALHHSLGRPFIVAGNPRPISMSIGVSGGLGPFGDGIENLRAAEIAARAAQADGGGQVRCCTSRLIDRAREEAELESSLYQAIQDGQMRVFYQPKVSWPERRIIGFEALVRWRHPRLGLVGPDRFIPMAERNGVISHLGRWVTGEVCRQLAEWRAAGLPLCPVAVNVSPNQLLCDGVAGLLLPLAQQEIPSTLVEFEITESVMMDTLREMEPILAELRAADARLAIDDFGTGHSSLGNLRKLPVDALKIDRSFVIDIERSKEARDIVATVVAMARALRLDVIAEGVETEFQADFLAEHGVRLMQGYLFSPPEAADVVTDWLRGGSSRSGLTVC